MYKSPASSKYGERKMLMVPTHHALKFYSKTDKGFTWIAIRFGIFFHPFTLGPTFPLTNKLPKFWRETLAQG